MPPLKEGSKGSKQFNGIRMSALGDMAQRSRVMYVNNNPPVVPTGETKRSGTELLNKIVYVCGVLLFLSCFFFGCFIIGK